MSEIFKNGSRGESVRKLQEDLNALGYSIQVDGIFGPATEKSVKALQAAFGYTVDGLVGDGTRALIVQQKTLKWRADQGTTIGSGPITKNVPEGSTGTPPSPTVTPTAAAPAGKGAVGNKTPLR